MNTIVVLFVTVCLGGGDDVACEEFALSVWRGENALALCRQELEREVSYSVMQGTVQTWNCVDVSDDNQLEIKSHE
jgi:hypothetical protein